MPGAGLVSSDVTRAIDLTILTELLDSQPSAARAVLLALAHISALPKLARNRKALVRHEAES